MHTYRTLSLLILTLGIIPGCKYSKHYNYRKQYLKKVFFAGPIPDGPAVIFIHGTKESVLSKMVHKLDYPLGVVPARTMQTSSVLSRIALTLDKADPKEFGLDRFYFYGWHGKLNFPSRMRAARRLYSVIKDHKGPLTIITHSHGCNVALHLVDCVERDPKSTLKIDRLIFLAAPVQVVTKPLVHAPLFKRVYSFYSTGDFVQVADLQGLYWESYAYTPATTEVPILSARVFDPAPNILQIRMFLDRHSPGHLSFMLSRLIKHIPRIIKMVDNRAAHGGYQETRNLYLVNVPPCGLPPEFLTPCDIKGKYVPRSTYYKTKRKLARCTRPAQNVQVAHH